MIRSVHDAYIFVCILINANEHTGNKVAFRPRGKHQYEKDGSSGSRHTLEAKKADLIPLKVLASKRSTAGTLAFMVLYLIRRLLWKYL